MGRKSKLTKKLVKTLKGVIDSNAKYTSPSQLIFLMNKELPEKARVTPQKFLDWISNPPRAKLEDPLYYQLLEHYADAMIQASIGLQKKIEDDPKGWQRFAWRLERLEPGRFHLKTGREKQPPNPFLQLDVEELLSKLDRILEIKKTLA